MNDGKISPIPEPVTPSEHDFIIAFRSLSREEQKKVLEDNDPEVRRLFGFRLFWLKSG